MANMSYCRFRNTLEALLDCYDGSDGEFSDIFIHLSDPLEAEEEHARVKLIKLCKQIAEDSSSNGGDY